MNTPSRYRGFLEEVEAERAGQEVYPLWRDLPGARGPRAPPPSRSPSHARPSVEAPAQISGRLLPRRGPRSVLSSEERVHSTVASQEARALERRLARLDD